MAQGKYTTAQFREIITASRSGSGTWPLEVASKIGRTYGALLTMLGRVSDAGVSLEKIEEALNRGIVPELSGSLTEFLGRVRDATAPSPDTIRALPDDLTMHAFTQGVVQEVATEIRALREMIMTRFESVEERLDNIEAAINPHPLEPDAFDVPERANADEHRNTIEPIGGGNAVPLLSS